jgi:hypothetical protein
MRLASYCIPLVLALLLPGCVVSAQGAPARSTDELAAAQRSVTVLLANEVRADSITTPEITLCIAFRRDGRSVPADSVTLAMTSRSGRRAVAPDHCPRTYDSMIATLDSSGRPIDARPRGWIDPYRLTVTSIESRSRDLMVIAVDVTHGMAGHRFQCTTRRREVESWSATCNRTASWLH